MIQDLHRYLMEYGIRPSLQRLAIMEYLVTHPTHPTADEIHTDVSPHAHFRCRNCGAVYDLPLAVDPEALEVSDPRHEVDEVQVYYKGYCERCRKKSN